MTLLLMGCTIGLIVGWNVFPQPKWVQSIYSKIVLKIKEATMNDEDV